MALPTVILGFDGAYYAQKLDLSTWGTTTCTSDGPDFSTATLMPSDQPLALFFARQLGALNRAAQLAGLGPVQMIDGSM